MIEEQFLQIDTVKRQNEGQVARKVDDTRIPGHHKSCKNNGITRKYRSLLLSQEQETTKSKPIKRMSEGETANEAGEFVDKTHVTANEADESAGKTHVTDTC